MYSAKIENKFFFFFKCTIKECTYCYVLSFYVGQNRQEELNSTAHLKKNPIL